MIKKENRMELTLQTRILEKKIDEGTRTVVAGILEGDTLSANKRFYPMSVVESVKDSMVGLKSMIGHDTDSPEDVVATITASSMSGKRLIGSFKFGTDEKSDMMFTKIKEGLIDSVSIRASGETRPGKINNENVDIVDSLQVWSVDLVVSGGVESAKVLQVFENSPTITYKDNQEDEMDEATKKKLEQAEANEAKLKELEDKNKELEEARVKAEEASKKAELATYKTQKLATIEDKDIRADVAENLSGDTKEAIDASFNKLKKLAEGIAKKSGSKIVMEPVNEGGNGEPKSLNDVFESKSIEKKEKVEILSALFGKA